MERSCAQWHDGEESMLNEKDQAHRHRDHRSREQDFGEVFCADAGSSFATASPLSAADLRDFLDLGLAFSGASSDEISSIEETLPPSLSLVG